MDGAADRPSILTWRRRMAHIIIKGKTNFGKTRSEREENIRKEWGPTMTDKQLDIIKHLERKSKEIIGEKHSHINPPDADKVE